VGGMISAYRIYAYKQQINELSSVFCTTQRRSNTTFKVNSIMLDHQTKFNIASLINVYTKRVR
jgi:hypothetical protein